MPNQHPKGPGKTIQDLTAGITPMLPGQPERIPWTWYDTQSYVSGTTVSLPFFQSVNADKTLSNMVAAGQIPSPQFYDLYHCSICYLVPFSATVPIVTAPALTGALNDVDRLSQGEAVFSVANKDYWQGPQLALPAGGGPFANLAFTSNGTEATSFSSTAQFAINGMPDLRNRYNFWGDITLPANQNFIWTLLWSAPLTFAPSTNRNIKVWMDGYLYRRVL
jgi:hypothetical protein